MAKSKNKAAVSDSVASEERPKQKHGRISFDVSEDDAAILERVIKSYGILEPSPSQVAKMLVRLGLEAWDLKK